jgi:uncharacterized Tic20 family protein
MSEPDWLPPQPYGPGALQPGGAVSQDDRNWAMASHVGSLITAWFAFGFIAPLVVMMAKSDSPFVRRHAAESLNFQLSMLIYSVVGGVVAAVVIVLTLGLALLVVLPVMFVVLLAVLVVVIQATVKASNGEDYRYPLTIRFFS